MASQKKLADFFKPKAAASSLPWPAPAAPTPAPSASEVAVPHPEPSTPLPEPPTAGKSSLDGLLQSAAESVEVTLEAPVKRPRLQSPARWRRDALTPPREPEPPVGTSRWGGFNVEHDSSRKVAVARQRLDDGKNAGLVLCVLADSEREECLQGRAEDRNACKTVIEAGSITEVPLDFAAASDSGDGCAAVQLPALPEDFSVMLVQGETGTGVTTVLRALRERYSIAKVEPAQVSTTQAVAATLDGARDLFPLVGLNDIKAWCRPYQALSNGQRQRVRLAQLLEKAKPDSGFIIDDLGSAVDIADAQAIAQSLQKLFRFRGSYKRVIIGTHVNILPYLQPDVVLSVHALDNIQIFNNPLGRDDRLVKLTLQLPGDTLEDAEEPTTQPLAQRGVKRSLARHLSDPKERLIRTKCPQKELQSHVQLDERTEVATAAFEVAFNGTSVCTVPLLDPAWLAKKDWSVGIVVGPSGSGKTTALRNLFPEKVESGSAIAEMHKWDGKASVLSEVSDKEVLKICCLPEHAWPRPFGTLSSSEQARASLARTLVGALKDKAQVVFVDEFTTLESRTAAQALSTSLAPFLKAAGLKVIFATVFEDVVGWLQPAWVLLTSKAVIVEGEPTALSPAIPEPLQLEPTFVRPELAVKIAEVTNKPEKQRQWNTHFHAHHYLTGHLDVGSDVYIARLAADDTPVGFLAVHKMPGLQHCACHRGLKYMVMEHRLVVLPCYQGFGLGTRLSDAVGKVYSARGEKYVSKTAHPRLASHREGSSCWQRHGNFMTAIEELHVAESGEAELRGPAPSFQLESDKLMIHAARLDCEEARGIGRWLHGRSFNFRRDRARGLRVPLPKCPTKGVAAGTYGLKGNVVFYRPCIPTKNPATNVFSYVGVEKYSIMYTKTEPFKLSIRIRGKLQWEWDASELTFSSNNDSNGEADCVEKAFKTLVALCLLASTKEGESANLHEAVRLLKAKESWPCAAVQMAKAIRLKKGEGRLLRKMRVTYSHEYVMPR
eukprot:TRINITY_DN18863_c0_g1_i1.p1 TRINITY_DN18863_c0_g1~~TRINITY_DN18863_c0_g1_i1.p1  ORF type:complete len:1003 (+),score=231.64 TRINITY_DN18863_c0_g1_i1:185-3193(+)